MSCPQCGAPISGAAISAPLTTVQETSKQLKLHIILSALLFWGGLLWFFVAASGHQPGQEVSPWPALSLFVGMVWYLVTKIRIWWHHK